MVYKYFTPFFLMQRVTEQPEHWAGLGSGACFAGSGSHLAQTNLTLVVAPVNLTAVFFHNLLFVLLQARYF